MPSTAKRRAEFVFGCAHITRPHKGQIEEVARRLGVAPGSGMRARLLQRYGGYACTLWQSAHAALNGIRSVDYLPARLSSDYVRDA
jgi:hypothetical protein